jgi:hypothetical protein
MDIFSVCLTLVLIGVAMYLVERFVPMDEAIKTILTVVIVLFVIVWLLGFFGVAFNGGSHTVLRP